MAHGSRFELRRFDVAGRLRLVVRVPVAPRPVTDEERRRTEEGRRRMVETLARAGRSQAADQRPPLAFADHHPLIRGLEIDAAGNVWVQPDPERIGRPGWVVFGSDGRVRAWYGGEVLQRSVEYRGPGYVLDVTRDRLGVPYVVKHRVPAPAGGR